VCAGVAASVSWAAESPAKLPGKCSQNPTMSVRCTLKGTPEKEFAARVIYLNGISCSPAQERGHMQGLDEAALYLQPD